MTSDFKRALGIFSILIIVVVLVVFGPAISQRYMQQLPGVQDPATAPPSAYVQAQLEKSIGFDYLISYTDSGFNPEDLKAKVGESIRISNNSSNDLWVAAVIHLTNLDEVPDLSAEECDESTFNSCYALHPYEFWEYTFTESETIQYQNILDKSKKGTITVSPEN